jgi:hypothetical protein
MKWLKTCDQLIELNNVYYPLYIVTQWKNISSQMRGIWKARKTIISFHGELIIHFLVEGTLKLSNRIQSTK